MKINRLLLSIILALTIAATCAAQTKLTNNTKHQTLSLLQIDAARNAITALRKALAKDMLISSVRRNEQPCETVDLQVALDEAEAYLPLDELKLEIRGALRDYQNSQEARDISNRASRLSDDPENAKVLREYIDTSIKLYPSLKKKTGEVNLSDVSVAAAISAKNHLNTASSLLLEQQ